tara:strand:+ start:1691 stop:2206 length:516 start_codon:yes stop_codon:yes gene_type:complete
MSTKTTAFGMFLLIMFLVASRVVPHPPNFTPVLAVAIFAPYFFRELAIAVSVPLVAMVLADLIIGMHSYMLWVYVVVAASTLISYILRYTGSHLFRVGALALGSCLIFFLVTNFGVWLGSGFYSKTTEGLIACYIAALPFFGNTLVSTVAFSGLFYGLMRMAEQQGRINQQ